MKPVSKWTWMIFCVSLLLFWGSKISSGLSTRTITIGIGHQSGCTDTYAGGVIMKEMGFLEKHLPREGAYENVQFKILWKDYTSGPPLTQEMIEGQVQIGVMGDYPLILNGYESQEREDYASFMVAFTGYNEHGSGNGIVVPNESNVYEFRDLKGQTLSVPFGSAAHGMVLKAMNDHGWVEGTDLFLVNQQPREGEASIRKNQISAHADFCPWSELIAIREYGRKIFDGSRVGVPYLHGVVVERSFSEGHPELVKAYLRALMETGAYIQERPQELAENLERWTGIEKEIQYLYFGPGGFLTHDPTFKPDWIRALKYDAQILEKMGKMGTFEIDPWLNDSWLREIYSEGGLHYETDQKKKDKVNVTGWDDQCLVAISEPRTVAQIWPTGMKIRSYASPLCMLQAYQNMRKEGLEIETVYTTDYESGLKLLGKTAFFVLTESESGSVLLSFSTMPQAKRFASRRSGKALDFDEALSLVDEGG